MYVELFMCFWAYTAGFLSGVGFFLVLVYWALKMLPGRRKTKDLKPPK